jgi:hypothetical protein
VEGYIFEDKDLDQFYDKFYFKLQKKLGKVKGVDPQSASELSQASTILGRPDCKRSVHYTVFRNDLQITCEAAGVGNCSLVLSDDSRFIQTVIESYVVKKCFRKALKTTLQIEFNLQVELLSNVL